MLRPDMGRDYEDAGHRVPRKDSSNERDIFADGICDDPLIKNCHLAFLVPQLTYTFRA